MDLKRVEYFVCVAKLGSFSKAAQMLKLTQPAISRRLSLLEEEVGAPLFERTSTGVVLTEVGEAAASFGCSDTHAVVSDRRRQLT